jgi:hypothetical protein
MKATRRDAIRLALCASAGMALGGWTKRRAGARYVVTVLLSGGLDAAYSTDPKTRNEVERWVDVPYRPEQLVEHRGVVIGPLLKPFLPVMNKLAIINGIRVSTANHNTGVEQFRCMRSGVSSWSPSILNIIGLHRDGQPLGSIDDGFFRPEMMSLLAALKDARPNHRAILREAMAQEAARLLSSRASGRAARTAEAYQDATALIERLPPIPPVLLQPTSGEHAASRIFEGVTWALENDLTRTVHVHLGQGQQWDSHNFNRERQEATAGIFFPPLASFLAELTQRKNAFGALSENTLVVIGSEIGRFPRVNAMSGKDHFPEVPVLFFGAGINSHGGQGSVFGRTGRQMESLPVSLASGMPGRASSNHAINIDDVGRTILELSGESRPQIYGYTGEPLRFLFA